MKPKPKPRTKDLTGVEMGLRPSPKARTNEQQEHYERVQQRNAAIAAGPGAGLKCPTIYGGRG